MFCFILFLTSTFAFDCLNDQGKPVDSWIALKQPKGTVYFYYDSFEKKFYTSPYSLNDSSGGALTHTVQQLWNKNNKQVNYVLYNDQVPKGQVPIEYNIDENESLVGKFGHTKGLFAFNSNDNSDNSVNSVNSVNSGFLLTHSIPLYPVGPQASKEYLGLGSNAFMYAQNILCLSVSATTINHIALSFQLNRPQIYESRLSVDSSNTYTHIRDLIDGKFSTEKICLVKPLETRAKMPFTMYSKTGEWNNDLYSGCVAPSQADVLWVESWIRGSADGPNCPLDNYDTLDIKSLDFAPLEGHWLETQDHSKWAITETKDTVCMGDINRMTTQYTRGGGTVCFEDSVLHNVLKKATKETDKCRS